MRREIASQNIAGIEARAYHFDNHPFQIGDRYSAKL